MESADVGSNTSESFDLAIPTLEQNDLPLVPHDVSFTVIPAVSTSASAQLPVPAPGIWLGTRSLVESEVIETSPPSVLLPACTYATTAFLLYVAVRRTHKYIRNWFHNAIDTRVSKVLDEQHANHQQKLRTQRRRHLVALAKALNDIPLLAPAIAKPKHFHRVALAFSRACALLEIIRTQDMAEESDRDRKGSMLRRIHEILELRLGILANYGYEPSSSSAESELSQVVRDTCGLVGKWMTTGLWDDVLDECVVLKEMISA